MTSAIELTIVHDVYKTKTVYVKMPEGDEFPETKQVFVKQMLVKKWFIKEAIVSIEQYVTKRHSIGKSRSVIFDRFSGRSYIVLHSPQDILHMMTQDSHPKTPIGFRHDFNIHPTSPQVSKY